MKRTPIDIETYDFNPVVVAKLRGNQLVLKCPHCGKRHHHGTGYGHRVAHCWKRPKELEGKSLGYTLIAGAKAPATP